MRHRRSIPFTTFPRRQQSGVTHRESGQACPPLHAVRLGIADGPCYDRIRSVLQSSLRRKPNPQERAGQAPPLQEERSTAKSGCATRAGGIVYGEGDGRAALRGGSFHFAGWLDPPAGDGEDAFPEMMNRARWKHSGEWRVTRRQQREERSLRRGRSRKDIRDALTGVGVDASRR
jgi:hypothetical protein